MQGFGNVGYHAALILHQEGGARIVSIGEWDGCIMNPEGLDPVKVKQYQQETGSIQGYPGATSVKNPQACLEVECDVLVPAALENQITEQNVGKLRCKVVAEGANGPTTPDAERALHERGVAILPDIYLNAGGVTVSYFEWTKNISHMRFGRMAKRFEAARERRMLQAIEQHSSINFTSDEIAAIAHGPEELDLVRSGLEETMVHALKEILEELLRVPNSLDLRSAAYRVAIRKVAVSYSSLGIFP
jgi:glutamate dehydrogenase (NAD(P)+)